MHGFASTVIEGWTFFVCSIVLFLCTWFELFSYRITLQVFFNKVLIWEQGVLCPKENSPQIYWQLRTINQQTWLWRRRPLMGTLNVSMSWNLATHMANLNLPLSKMPSSRLLNCKQENFNSPPVWPSPSFSH